MKNDCIFCAIADGEIPCFKVYEDEDVLAYLDINPCSEGHTLVIPKKHTTGLVAVSEEELCKLICAVKKVATHIQNVLGCDGFNILQNNGEAAGQSVFHIHFHIVPRYNGGEKLSFRSTKADMTHLAELAKQLHFGK